MTHSLMCSHNYITVLLGGGKGCVQQGQVSLYVTDSHVCKHIKLRLKMSLALLCAALPQFSKNSHMQFTSSKYSPWSRRRHIESMQASLPGKVHVPLAC